MKKYDIIFESIQEKVKSGELTMEDAQRLNDIAFEKYCDDETEYEEVTESTEGDGVTYEEYLDAMEEELFGEASKEEADELAAYGLKKRDISNAWKVHNAQLMDQSVDGKQLDELSKTSAQRKGTKEMSPEDRKRNIRAALSSRKPHYNDVTSQKQRVSDEYKDAIKILDDHYTASKKRILVKKRQEREHEEIKKGYMDERKEQMKKIIKDNVGKK